METVTMPKILEDWFKTHEAESTRTDYYYGKVVQMKTLSGTEMFPYLKKLLVLCGCKHC